MSTGLSVGYVRSAITPPIGVYLEGYASRLNSSRCIYDDLYVRCLTFDTNSRKVTIVVADLIGIPYSFYKRIVEAVGDENVVVGATHTHSSPSPHVDKVYTEYFVKSVVGCIKASRNSLKSVKSIVIGRSSVPQLVYNRRKPNHGAIDPEIYVVDLDVALITNFTSHPVILGPDNLCISADYPGALARWVKLLMRKDAVFLPGCQGNINPYTLTTDLRKPYDRWGGGYDEVERYGRILAYESIKAIELGEKIDTSKCMDIVFKIKNVELKIRRDIIEALNSIVKEDVEALAKEMEKVGRIHEAWRLRLAKLLLSEIGMRKSVIAPIAALNICNTMAILFLPAEVFVEHQLYIKSRSPFKYTIVSSYFNSYWLYIPTREAFEEGGYEVETSIVEPGEGEELREEALNLLHQTL